MPRKWGLDRRVEPDLFDRGVVQQRLQRSEAGHGVKHEPSGRFEGTDGRKRRQQGSFVVVADCLFHQAPDFAGLPEGVQPAAADQLADLILDDAHSFHGAPNMTATPPPGAVQLGLKLKEPAHSGKGAGHAMWTSGRPGPYSVLAPAASATAA